MIYQDFRNKHEGEDIIVAGCGTSVSIIQGGVSCITIGVNDFSRLFTPTYTVMINDIKSFKADRWKHMSLCKSDAIFTHIKNTESKLPIKHQERLVKIQLGRSVTATKNVNILKNTVDYTSNSPFVGVIIAAWMGAKRIGLIGVDFTDDHFFKKTGTHVLNRKLPAIITEYDMLKDKLYEQKIEFYNLSPISKLRLERMTVKDFIDSGSY